MPNRRISPFVLALLASVAGAQHDAHFTLAPLIHEGEAVIGMGALEGLSRTGVNDGGMWVAAVDTTFPDPGRDGAILRNGFVTLREGTALLEPPSATQTGGFGAISLTDSGELGLLMEFEAGSVRTGMFWNLVCAVATNDPFVHPDLPAGTIWINLLRSRMNENRQMLVLGELQAPPDPLRRSTLARYTVDTFGEVIGVELLASRNLPIAALGGDALESMVTTAQAIAQNNAGDFLCVVDGVIGGSAVLWNMETVLAQENFPSPVPGLDWQQLGRVPHLALNDFGEYVLTGSTEPSAPTADALYTIVKNGEVFAREGDLIGDLTEPMGRDTGSPIHLANSGDVFWCWQDEDSTRFAFLRNHEPIVEVGETRIGANLVQGIPLQDGFDVSDDGRFWIGRVDVQTLGATLLRIDFGLVLPIPGCGANPGRLSLAGGWALPGETLVLSMDDGQVGGVRPVLFFSSAPRVPGSPCGASTPFGELLISLGDRFGRVQLPAWNGTDPSLVSVAIPDEIALVDATAYVQGMFVDVAHTPADDVRLTNALKIEIGAP